MLYIWCHRWCSLGRWGHTEVQFEMLFLSFMKFLLISSCPVSWMNVLTGSIQQRELQQTAPQQHFTTWILLRWGCGGSQFVGGGPAHLWRWESIWMNLSWLSYHLLTFPMFVINFTDLNLTSHSFSKTKQPNVLVMRPCLWEDFASLQHFTSPILSYWNPNTTTSINM